MAENQGFFSGVLSPEETERAIDNEILGAKPDAASFIGGFIGKALGGGGYANDPRMIQAVKMKALQEKVSAIAKEKNIDIASNPEEFTKIVAATSWEMGMPDIGFNALKQGRQMQLERQKVETEQERAGTYAASVEAQERIADAHDRTSIEVANITAQAKLDAKKGKPFKFGNANLSKNFTQLFELDPDLERFLPNLGDNTLIMGDDAADMVAKLARDNEDADPEELKAHVQDKIKARVYRSGGSFNPLSSERFGLDKAIYFRSPEEVKKAFKAGDISKNEALNILRNGFDGE